MTNEKEYITSFIITDKTGTPKTTTTKVFATSETDAIEKAKEKKSVHEGGSNFQVIPGASALQT